MPAGQPAIAIAPVGAIAEDLIRELVPAVEARFPGRTARAVPGLDHPDDAYFPGRDQYLTDPVLNALAGLVGDAERLLGVADLDLFSFRLDYVIGVAAKEGPVAMVALARLRPEFWGEPPEPRLLLERASKEAIHELAHTYGLGHCEDPACVMSYSTSPEETDRKSDGFCSRHEGQLAAALHAGGQESAGIP
jgi:archaemetzincin